MFVSGTTKSTGRTGAPDDVSAGCDHVCEGLAAPDIDEPRSVVVKVTMFGIPSSSWGPGTAEQRVENETNPRTAATIGDFILDGLNKRCKKSVVAMGGIDVCLVYRNLIPGTVDLNIHARFNYRLHMVVVAQSNSVSPTYVHTPDTIR